MIRATPLFFALVGGVAARADLELRLAPEVRAGGAFSTDLFLGAGFGPGAELIMAPSIKADASFHPRWKLRAEYDFAYAFAQVNGSSAYDHLAHLTLRHRLETPGGAPLWLEIAGKAGAERFSDVGLPADQPVGRQITAYDMLAAAPQLRYVGASFEAAFGYAFVFALSSESDRFFVHERSHRATALLSAALGQRLAGQGQYRFTYNDADRGELLYTSHELALSGHWQLLEWLSARLELGAQYSDFLLDRLTGDTCNFDDPDTCDHYKRRDLLLRAGATLALQLREGVSLEVAYGYAQNLSTEATVEAGRHLGYLGLRAEVEPWRY